jgi:ankyrin repeat protein
MNENTKLEASSACMCISGMNDFLLNAIQRNDSTAVLSFVESESRLIVNEALIVAAQHGRLEIMSLLLDAGAAIDAADQHQNTACYAAVSNGHFAALQLLLDRGANTARDASRLLAAASDNADDRMSILLLDAGAPLDSLSCDSLLSLATSATNVGMLKRLLARGVKLSELRGSGGVSVCHSAVENLNLGRSSEFDPFLRVLVEDAGVDANPVDESGLTSLHCAAMMHNATSLRVLVKWGAEIDRQDNSGRTALHYLCGGRANDGKCAELLLALGADVHMVSKEGESACHFAATRRLCAVLCALVAAGGDLDQPNNAGDTPRMMVIRNDRSLPLAADVVAARRRIAKTRIDFVRQRALEICVGLQPLDLDALQLCEILMHSFGAIGSLIAFHQWWTIAIKVKHFH